MVFCAWEIARVGVAQPAKEAGARVIALDVNLGRLAFCQRALGVPLTINPALEDPMEALRRAAGGDLPTAVFDATGSPWSTAAAFNFPAHGWRLVFVGLFQGKVAFNDPNFHGRELTLLASRHALAGDFARIIRLVESGRIDTAPWVTHRSSLAEVTGAFPAWTRP